MSDYDGMCMMIIDDFMMMMMVVVVVCVVGMRSVWCWWFTVWIREVNNYVLMRSLLVKEENDHEGYVEGYEMS
jgi:hypothetical protein